MNTIETVQLIDDLQKNGIKRETAAKLLDYVENQKGELATKQDLESMKQATKQDFRILEQDLESMKQATKQNFRILEQGQRWLKWSMIAGFGALLTMMLYLHDYTRESQAELKADINQRIAEMNERITETNEQIVEMNKRINKMEQHNIERHRELKELLKSKR